MESNDDQNLEAIHASVGRLVWVRRRNGSWWPGQTLLHDQLPQSSLLSPKLGTPIKLLGRDDVSVDWYVLEKSKSVKAFRCGEYDVCIEKAKAAAAAASSSNKKSVKCTLREDAINSALEIESAHLGKEDNLCSSSGGEETDSDAGEAEDGLDSAPELLQSSMSSQEMNNVGASNVQLKRRRRRTPNDSEDDGTGGVKRMRGLEDIGKEHVGAIVEHRQEVGSLCDVNLSDSMSNGNVIASGKKKVCSSSSPLALKRNRSQVVNVNECTKRRNRRRQLTKVLESTAMVCVPVTCQGTYDSNVVSGMESAESMKTVSVVINNNSDSTGVSCENVVEASHKNKAKDTEISSVSLSMEDDSSDQLYDVPLTGEEKLFAGFPAACSTSSLGRGIGSVKQEVSNGSAHEDPTARRLVSCDLNAIEKRTERWQLKGKRNSRQMSKNQEARRNVFDKEANDNGPMHLSVLYDVKIEVKANYSKPHSVPLVSRMSGLNGKAIVGRPLTVEVLEEGYCNGMVMPQVVVKAKKKSLSEKNSKKRKSQGGLRKPLKSKKKASSLSKKTRRLSTLTSQNQKLTERSKKQTTEKAKETVVACIPLKVVFSRINQVLKGSSRQMQHRTFPSAAKT